MPNPIQIANAINACFDDAEQAGYSIYSVFLSGHSLGGVVLESYVSTHSNDNMMGLILFGSFLPDTTSTNNSYPIPVLCAMGTLDGGGLSYAFREYRESRIQNEREDYPVLLVEDVNHGQVASGILPDTVIEHDIDPVVDLDTAHERYAYTAVRYMVTAKTTRDQFPEDVVTENDIKLKAIKVFTADFFEPFVAMQLQEDSTQGGYLKNKTHFSPWMVAAQLKLLGDFEIDGPDLSEVTVTTEIVPKDKIGEVKPQVIDSDIPCKNVTVTTYSYNKYAFDPTEHDHLVSAEVIKAKFKMAEDVLDHLCIDYEQRLHCKDINEEAFRLAQSVASDKALERYDVNGTKLIFTDDYETWWGPGWEFDRGLNYTKINDTHTAVTATSLLSPTFFKAHYCDLMSPYRALEWIYIEGLKHGPLET